jgi:hypothetical protein
MQSLAIPSYIVLNRIEREDQILGAAADVGDNGGTIHVLAEQ